MKANQRRTADALNGIKQRLSELIDRNADAIADAYEAAFVAHCEDESKGNKQFRFSLGLGAVMEPHGSNDVCAVKLRFSVPRSDQDEFEVSDQPELPGMQPTPRETRDKIRAASERKEGIASDNSKSAEDLEREIEGETEAAK